MRTTKWMTIWAIIAMLAGGAAGGCDGTRSLGKLSSPTIARKGEFPQVDAATVADRDPRQLPVFDARSGDAIDWPSMLERLAGADVIILGEQHDDGVAHAVQLAVTQDVAARYPGRGALSMEMLERDDQPLADDYLDGLIDAATFAKLTSSESWAGEGSWKNWYQPIIDAAADEGWRIVAANAPRRYVRKASDGDDYDTLRAIPQPRRSLYDFPQTWPAEYRQRFVDVMSGKGDDDEDDQDEPASTAPASAPASQPASRPASPHGPLKPEQVDSALRTQMLWDATMADSIARARRSGSKPVIHLVGQFHSDFAGGTVQETRARLGKSARILTISMQRRDVAATSLRASDRDRADFVIYTGKRPPEPAEEAATAAAPSAQTQPK